MISNSMGTSTMSTLSIFATVIGILAPYAAALIAGVANGSFMKFRNLDKLIGHEIVVTYCTKISYFAATALSFFYCICIVAVVGLVHLYSLGKLSINFATVIFPAMTVYFLYSILFIFCEMRIVGRKIYFYNLLTMFRVVTIEIDDIVAYRSDGFMLQSWISLKTKNNKFSFNCISNIDEFVETMNELKGGANG